MSNNISKLNPYDILAVSRSASNAEITKAVAKAMKLRQYPANIIAQAQKNLLNPQKRLVSDYLCPILPVAERFKHQDLSILDSSVPQLELLPFVSEPDIDISSASDVSSLDRIIGQTLFPEI
ncbi:MAG: molecular chaperone DnaJ [Aphanocapsa sp. GSE-SYN-MK-11-07L]|jgi:hypothetical protein|nr:molecular chaperone DnaJ [Aphanocapsa sp. GSE-SYN-MK-11-07L]